MRIALSFGVLFLLTFVVGGAIAIFGFDYFERAWGRSASLQVYVWIALPMAALSGLGAWGGAKVARVSSATLKWQASLLPAALFAVVATSLSWAVGGATLGLFGLALLCLAGSFLIAAGWLRWSNIRGVEG